MTPGCWEMLRWFQFNLKQLEQAFQLRKPRSFPCLAGLHSGCGLPQLYAFVEAGYVQISVGQEHVNCLNLLAELAQQFTSPPTANGHSEDTGAKKSVESGNLPLFQSFDDIRAGSFRFVTASSK